MKVKRLHLQNYGRFEDLKIDFAPTAEKSGNVTVIVGNNGAGKSQILQALATGLSWLIVELQNKNHEGEFLKQSIIKNNSENTEIKITLDDLNRTSNDNNWKKNNLSVAWKISASREKKLSPAVYGIDDYGLSELVDNYQNIFNEDQNASLPILAFYPVDRVVNSAHMEINGSSTSSQLAAYDNALAISTGFEIFFSWFREREDIENEKNIDLRSLSKDDSTLLDSLESEFKFTRSNTSKVLTEDEKESMIMQVVLNFKKSLYSQIENSFYDKMLTSVRQSINFFTDFKNPRIRRQGTPTMIVEKDGEELDVNQLSQGEKSLLALVGDIARRLALLNPSLDNPLEGEGVVMIDEVDLHLHPKWQHDLIDKLVKTFPNVQFILTTHSPHVISDNPDILLYSLDDGELIEMPNVYGEDVNTVLTKIFDVPFRDSDVEEQFNIIRRAISKRDYLLAEDNIEHLGQELPSDHLELLKCRLLLAQAKVNDKGDKPSYAED